MIIPYGPMVNALAVIVGGGVGMLFGTRFPARIQSIVFQSLGLCILLLGIKMALVTENTLVMIFSVLLGSVVGGWLELEAYLIRFGNAIKKILKLSNPQFTESMVNASVLFCIGAMAILGSFDEGLRADRTVVFSKAILDGFAAMALASAYGIGVLFSAIPVFIYQGSLTVFASALQPWLSAPVMTELTAVGGVLIMGIGLNLLDIVKIPLSNMLPALPAVIVLATYF